MNIVEQLSKLFGSLSNLKVDERFSTLRISASIEAINQVSEISVKVFKQNIPERDNFKISIVIEDQDALVLARTTEIQSYVESFKDYFQYFEDNESITMTLEIDKNKVEDTISIYSFESLLNFSNSQSFYSVLEILTNLKVNSEFLNFEFLEDGQRAFHSNCFRFGYSFKFEFKDNSLEQLKSNCYFTNYSKFPYAPTDFQVIKRPEIDNSLVQHLDSLCVLFSIISIYDYSTIKKSALEYKLKGYRLYQGDVSFDQNFTERFQEYINLYEWIYDSNGNVTDKLGVARNIISLHIREGDIGVDDTLIHSIKSAHQTYLKENVSNYLNLRSKILDELSWISQKSSDVIEKYLQAYKSSSLTFVSFFISIFLLRTLNKGEFNKVFTVEVTLIALAFLSLSICYLFFSRFNVLKERDRLIRKYQNIKNRYTDLLITEDINRILDGDSEFSYEKSFIEKRVKSYTWLWAITIIILITIILSVSELVPCSLYYN
ncbi:MAG: hypothetical protein AAF600_01610 [Bacteroidota bacterium]